MLNNQPDQSLLTGGIPQEEPKVSVSANALRQVLEALVGPPQLIRELLVTRGLPGFVNPIDKLIDQFNAEVKRLHPEAPDEPPADPQPSPDSVEESSTVQPAVKDGDQTPANQG